MIGVMSLHFQRVFGSAKCHIEVARLYKLAYVFKYYYNSIYIIYFYIGNIIVLLITASKAQKQLADHVRVRRLNMNLSQAGLAERSGVALPTLRKFEQQSVISLESFLKLLMVVGGLEEVVRALEPATEEFSSIDEVLAANASTKQRKRGRSK